MRDSSFLSRSAHPGDFRQAQHPFENVLSRRVFDLVNGNCVGDAKAPGFRSTQRFQMRAATERLTNVVNVRANIKAFAAQDREIDFR